MSARRLHPEKEQFAPLSFTPASGVSPRDNLSAFIRMARDDINGLTKTFEWSARSWRGIGVFCPLGALRGSDQHEALSLHPEFADFAKAIICYFFAQLPSQQLSAARLAALRCLHAALMDVTGTFDPLEIDILTLNRAAALARDHYSHSHAYAVGRQLANLARFLSQSALTWRTTGSWRSPIGPAKNLRQRAVGLHRDSDEYRKTRLPSERVLEAVGSVFARGFDLDDPRTHADVYVTSAVAMLMAGSSRGSEIHELTADLEVWENDPDGKPQYGWRFRSLKSRHQSYRIKWIPEEWRPIAQEAIRRIRLITEGPRAFARYVESQLKLHETSPDAPLRFYRHLACPDVADDQPLTAAQAATALSGRVVDRREATYILNQNWNLITADNAHTLDSLWQVVLNRLPRGFPFVSHAKNVRLKYSEALFCMRKSQLKRRTFSSPVTLWIPSLDNLNSYLGVQIRDYQFFVKHGFFDDRGQPLALQTHKIRHLLDTIAQQQTGDTFLGAHLINYWAGREKSWQGSTYDHEPVTEKLSKVVDALTREDGSLAVIDVPQAAHWQVVRPHPSSVADIEMNYRSPVLATFWGACEHDYLIEPCPFHKDCLNCKEFSCIKHAGKDLQERLDRLRDLLTKIVEQQEKAKVAVAQGAYGAQSWFDHQAAYRERVEQLITLLDSPDVPEGAKIRLANPTANSHLHRVLRQVAVRAIECNAERKDAIDALLLAIDENRGVALLHGGGSDRLALEDSDG